MRREEDPGIPAGIDEQEARDLLAPHVQRLRRMPYADLLRYMKEEETFQVMGRSGVEYTIEIQAFWESRGKKDGNLRVTASIDDGESRWRFLPILAPITDGFIMAPDGSFVGE